MKNTSIYCVIIMLTVACALSIAPRGSMQQTKTTAATTVASKADTSKFALLVGINDYKDYKEDAVRDLHGTNNDVELMRSLLVDVYKFDYRKNAADSPVRILLNSEATQAVIRENFRKQLIDNAKNYFERMAVKDPKNGATVVFYYSGHGSRIPDASGDETDGIDETIVPSDSTTNVATQKDIIDDEFDEWFKELKNYTANITFIFDSCHSGTVTRGGTSKSVERAIPAKNGSRGDPPTATDGINIPSETSYATVSGSLPTQQSQEDNNFVNADTKQPQWNGALTYNFVTLLRQDPDITYREIVNRIQPAVAQYNQTPQAEGDIDRTVFGSSETRGKTPIFITGSKSVSKKFEAGSQPQAVQEVTMAVGSIVGAGKDAAIAVFAKKPNEKIRSQIGSGIVTSATDFQSTAEVTLSDNLTAIPPDAIVSIISPSFSKAAKHVVALDFAKSDANAKGATALTVIEDRLKSDSMLKTVRSSDLLAAVNRSKSAAPAAKTGEDWEVAVVRGTYQDFKLGNPQPEVRNSSAGKGDVPACSTIQFGTDGRPMMPPDAQFGYFLISRYDRMPLYDLWYAAENPNAGACLADALVKHARIENLRNLSSGGSTLNDDVRVELVRMNSIDEARAEIEKCNREANQPLGGKDAGKVPQLKSGDLFYLKITNASSKDLYVYLFSLQTSGAISLLYPPDGSARSEKLPAGRTICTIQKEILFKVDPPEVSPPGVETLKVIAAKQEFPASLLTQTGIAKGGSRGSNSPLDQIINQATAGARTSAVSIAVDDWATKTIPIEIVNP